MKVFLRKTVEGILMRLSSAMLKKHSPDVIGLTGSVGKSSAKEAIFTVLSHEKRVRRNIKNYNNEIGLPLTILGLSSAGFNIFLWFGKIFKGILVVLFQRNYPEILVLEMGADRPGDIKVLTSLVRPRVGVVTAVGPSHLEFFPSIEDIAREKGQLVSELPRDGFAILNNDDPNVRVMQDRTTANVLTYGFSDNSDIYADVDSQSCLLDADRWISEKGATKSAMSFKVSYRGSAFPVRLPRVIGHQYIYTALAAIGCGIVYKMDFMNISRAIMNFRPPPGRMNLVRGIKDTLIIDDTYNSAPASAKAALESLAKIKTSGRRIAVLGDMLELGLYSEKGHKEIGTEAAKYADILITIGPLSEMTQAEFIRSKGGNGDSFHYNNSVEAAKALQEMLEERDVVLAKGSQSIRVEKVVKEIMAEPLRAPELLVRQEARWLRR